MTLGYEKLASLRKEIDRVDASIVRAFAKRATLSRKIGALKKKGGGAVTDEKRKKQLIATRVALGKKRGLSPALIREVFEAIHKDSVKIQKRV